MTVKTVAAVDLGAESGRVTAVSFDGERLRMTIANRFANTPVVTGGALRWNTDDLWGSIRAGLGVLAAGDAPISSVGVDTWGVDYGLLDESGHLLDAPISYRDDRNTRSFADARAAVGADRLYLSTGVQVLAINTVFGLMADVRDDPDRLTRARTLLMMPDVFHHLLSGSRVAEYTGVSTSGAYDMAGNRWATELLDDLDVPTHMLPEVVPPGTDVGSLLPGFATGALAGARVIVPPGHDTASAVVGVPLAEPGGLYISSGTWSLVGVETPTPVITAESMRANLTNEGGYAGTIRLLRNVMGLWILQECRRQWLREGTDISYPDLATMASTVPGLVSIINPDDPRFLAPGDMPSRVRAYCAETGSPVPQSIPEVVRCVVDSLALSYRAVVDYLVEATGVRPPSVNIVGGGADNRLLSQLTADATGLPVHCGPTEGTALGNGAVQLAALGEFSGLGDIRRAIAASTQIHHYAPRSGEDWAEAQARFERLVERDQRAEAAGR
ncbi:L-rhamnulokinase [Nakamurella panacisegetis]|uniref:L-rhamnulokinase n=1 Tax=Nakamurella panacisegetis TaxID=1090615 RepID=A0A1H0K1A3_9ACTN|nr:rhamnulokinase family protein [Nakamurella panacisegetis]SDO49706.1 L-rhamnulokinase [Nakamurella panacisegetis]